VRNDVSINNETLLVTDFVNFKIMSAQFSGGTHRGNVCMRVFIRVSAHTYMSICVCTIFLKKITETYLVRESVRKSSIFKSYILI
jgi:hypothetical protein